MSIPMPVPVAMSPLSTWLFVHWGAFLWQLRLLFSFLAQLETSASEYHQWRLDACEDLENLKVEYGEYRKRKADQILEREA